MGPALVIIIIIIIIKSLINSAALKNSDALQACHSVLRNRCAFRCRAKVAVDSDAAAGEESTGNIVYDTCLIPSMERVEVNTVNSQFLLTRFN